MHKHMHHCTRLLLLLSLAPLQSSSLTNTERKKKNQHPILVTGEREKKKSVIPINLTSLIHLTVANNMYGVR